MLCICVVAGGVEAVDDVKPENYQWYKKTRPTGSSRSKRLERPRGRTCVFQFEPGAATGGGAQPVAGNERRAVRRSLSKPGSMIAIPRAVSMGIDRDAIIKSVMYGYGEKNWSQMISSKGVAHASHREADYKPRRSEEVARGHGFQGCERRRVPARTRAATRSGSC